MLDHHHFISKLPISLIMFVLKNPYPYLLSQLGLNLLNFKIENRVNWKIKLCLGQKYLNIRA